MVSVCMATYNGEKYIKEQIRSILEQLNIEDELIISDDGSTDNTLSLIREFNDKRIKITTNKNDKGYTGNFYCALEHAKGDYIFLSDQDDVWLSNKIQVTIKYLDMYDFVVSDCYETNELLEIVCDSRFKKYNVKQGFLNSLLRCRYIGCCMAFTKKVLSVLLPPPSFKNYYPHDLWITLICEYYFDCITIPDRLIYYRRHGENASNGGDNSRSKRSLVIRVLSRFLYLYKVISVKSRIKKVKKVG